jgi:hypothetical protein
VSFRDHHAKLRASGHAKSPLGRARPSTVCQVFNLLPNSNCLGKVVNEEWKSEVVFFLRADAFPLRKQARDGDLSSRTRLRSSHGASARDR